MLVGGAFIALESSKKLTYYNKSICCSQWLTFRRCFKGNWVPNNVTYPRLFGQHTAGFGYKVIDQQQGNPCYLLFGVPVHQ